MSPAISSRGALCAAECLSSIGVRRPLVVDWELLLLLWMRSRVRQVDLGIAGSHGGDEERSLSPTVTQKDQERGGVARDEWEY